MMNDQGNNSGTMPNSAPEHTAPVDNTRAPRQPDYVAYNVRDTASGKGHWNRVGAAWQHSDGKGLQLQLDSTPLDGKVTLREMRDERMQGYADQRQQQAQTQPQNPRANPTPQPTPDHGYQQ